MAEISRSVGWAALVLKIWCVAADETEDEEAEREEEEEETGLAHKGAFSQNPTVPEVGMAPSREPLQPSVEEEEEQGEHEFKGETTL